MPPPNPNCYSLHTHRRIILPITNRELSDAIIRLRTRLLADDERNIRPIVYRDIRLVTGLADG